MATYLIGHVKGAKGDKGDTGSAAGFGTPTASVDANVGTPSVTVTATGPDTAKVFDFEFQNMKGAKGDKGDKGDTGNTGAAAGFGTPTASVDSNTGTPSVSITASGSDTSKVFDFQFHNLKGETGATGPTGPTGPADTTALNIVRSTSTDAYKTTKSYNVGDHVIYNNTLYRCKTACSAASWSTNQSNFESTTLTKAVTDLNASLSNATTFSTTEKVVGKLDGTLLYQKEYTGYKNFGDSNKKCIFDSSFSGTLQFAYGIVLFENGSRELLPYGEGNITIKIAQYNTELYAYGTNTSSTHKGMMKIQVFYTK